MAIQHPEIVLENPVLTETKPASKRQNIYVSHEIQFRETDKYIRIGKPPAARHSQYEDFLLEPVRDWANLYWLKAP